MNTPVLFLIFNRPELTRQVFEAIRAARPRRLFVVADGPRCEHPTDAERCTAARAVIDNVDWPCEVFREYSEVHVGRGVCFSSGITEAFRQFESAIILEDDCVPDPRFFPYCETLLERYWDEPRVMCISGDQFQQDSDCGEAGGGGGHRFSKYPHPWGWATWRRAWELYDFGINNWPRWRDAGGLREVCPHGEEAEFWVARFDRCFRGDSDTWDQQWTLCCWMHGGLTVLPNVNLVRNVSFGPDSAYARCLASLPSGDAIPAIDVPPSRMEADSDADFRTFRQLFQGRPKPRTKVRTPARRLVRGLRQQIRSAASAIGRAPVVRDVVSGLRIYRDSELRARRRELRRLEQLPRYFETETSLLGRPIRIADARSFTYDYSAIFERGIYEFESDTETPTIIDGGANIGLATLYIKSRIPGARVVAFEPDPKLFRVLSRNVEMWNLTDVELHNSAVWSDNTVLPFVSEGAHSGALFVSDGDPHKQAERIDVRAEALSGFLQRPVDFLKLDIEGAETEVLRSCELLLPNVKKLFVEYHSYPTVPQSLAELLGILDRTGFRVCIHSEVVSQRPYMAPPRSVGMDLGLNIFGWKDRPHASPAETTWLPSKSA